MCWSQLFFPPLSPNKSFIVLLRITLGLISVILGKCFSLSRIKVCARLKVCNWLARHVWNSQMSMKFKEAVKVGCGSAHRASLEGEGGGGGGGCV